MVCFGPTHQGCAPEQTTTTESASLKSGSGPCFVIWRAAEERPPSACYVNNCPTSLMAVAGWKGNWQLCRAGSARADAHRKVRSGRWRPTKMDVALDPGRSVFTCDARPIRASPPQRCTLKSSVPKATLVDHPIPIRQQPGRLRTTRADRRR